MKKLMILLFFLITGLSMNVKAEPRFGHGGFELFYSSLSPYGTWIQIDGGINVWRPIHMRTGWLPYKYGRWIWTEDGWYWNSDEPFGYIVFHYGRWYYDDYYGWIWIPDDVWAPAWVEWRYDNDYIGWAPLPPYASFSVGFGIRFTTGYVTPYRYYHFVKYRYLCDRYVYKYYEPERYKYRIYSGTKFRTNYGYSDGRVINRGVDVDYIRKRSGGRIVERNIDRVDNARDFKDRGDRNSGRVRAYIINPNKVQINNDRNYEVRRGERSSTLDINRIAIDRSNNSRNNPPRIIERNNDRNVPTGPEPGKINNGSRHSERPQINNRDRRNGERIKRDAVREQNKERSGSRGNSFQNERRNENKNTKPQIRRESTERKAPEIRRENQGNRSNGRESNSDRRKR